jgi:hypothetical protein
VPSFSVSARRSTSSLAALSMRDITSDQASVDAQLARKRTRLGWQVAIVAGAVAVIFAFIGHQRGDVFGLRPKTALRLPFVVGVSGMLAYIILASLRSGRILTRGRVIERSATPRRFFLHLSVLAFLAAVVIVGTAALVYLDLFGLKGS